MAWQIRITKTAEKQILKLDRLAQKRITQFLKEQAIADNPRLTGKALRGNRSELWRYRIGDYRLICSIDDKASLTLLLEVKHRREAYR